MSTNNAATAGATVKTMTTAMSAVNILRFKVVTLATDRADPTVYPGAPETVTVPAGMHAGQAAEDFTSPMRCQPANSVFPAQERHPVPRYGAGTQVRGVEPHITPVIPDPDQGTPLCAQRPWSTPAPPVVYNPSLATPIGRQALM